MAADDGDRPLKRTDLKACLFTKDVQAVQRSGSCEIKPNGFRIQIPPYFEVRLQAMCPKPLANGKAGDGFFLEKKIQIVRAEEEEQERR